MTLLDYILTVVLGYCLIRGIFRGVVRELSAIIGVLAGFYFAFSFHSRLSPLLMPWVGSSTHANIISFLVILIGSYLIINLLGTFIKYLLNIAAMGWTDRIGGALFGALKGIFIVAVLVAMMTTFLPRNNALLKDSLLARQAMGLSAVMVRAVSTDFKSLFETHRHELRQTWQNRSK